MFTHQEITRRMGGAVALLVFGVVTLWIGSNEISPLRGDGRAAASSAFRIAALVAFVPTAVYAYLQQVRQMKSPQRGQAVRGRDPVVYGVAAVGAALIALALLGQASPQFTAGVWGAGSGFWFGAAVGSAAALIPRWSRAPSEDPGGSWVTDGPAQNTGPSQQGGVIRTEPGRATHEEMRKIFTFPRFFDDLLRGLAATPLLFLALRASGDTGIGTGTLIALTVVGVVAILILWQRKAWPFGDG